jgi:anaerobic selenocysteine-containing dehydrogenase
LTAGHYQFNFNAVRRPDLQPGESRVLNMVRFGRALLEWQDPPLYSLFVQSNNPATTCPEQNLVRRGLAREDLFTVVHDSFLTDTARYADLVLPASTSFESDDLYRGYGTHYVQYGPQVLPPQGEARSNVQVIAALAQRLGLDDPVFSRSVPDHIAALLDVTEGPLADVSLAEVLDGKPHRLNIPVLGHPFDQAFPTPSGKLQLACPELAARGLPDLPDYDPDLAEVNPAYPLRLVTAPGHHLHHSSFDGVASLVHSEGGPWVHLHPQEAQARDIESGQAVELFNDAGGVGLYAQVTTDVPVGVAVVEGHRPQSHYLSGGPLNRLCSDRFSDLGEGATYQNTWLNVRRLPNAE